VAHDYFTKHFNAHNRNRETEDLRTKIYATAAAAAQETATLFQGDRVI